MIQNAIKQLAAPNVKPSHSIITGTVKSINKAEKTCTVEPHNGDAEFVGVKLQANPNNTKGLCVFPTVGSDAMLLVEDDDFSAAIVLCSDIEAIEAVIKNHTLTFDAKGVKLTTPTANLTTEINNIIAQLDGIFDFLTQPNFISPAGPVTLSPAAAPIIAQKKTEIALIKQKINTLLA
jgi:hypothetical protein